jgi:TolA-binding protein
MKAALRLFFARCMMGALLLLLSLGLASASVTLDVYTGFENSYRLNSWTPLVVQVGGTARASEASLQVVVKNNESRRIYSQPLRLPDGPVTERRVFYFRHDTSGGTPEISVQLIVNGRAVVVKKVEGAIPLDETQLVLIALSQDQSGLNFLNSIDLGFRHPSPPAASPVFTTPQTTPSNKDPSTMVEKFTRVLYPRDFQLPDAPAGYDSVDVILIGDLALDTLTEDQWDAIVQWTRQGGLLVISGGADINRFRTHALKELLPIVPSEVRQVSDLPGLRMRYNIHTPRVHSLPLVVGALKPDASLVCAQEDLPLISLRRAGLGSVVFTAFDITAPELRAWDGQSAMWRDFLSLGQRQPRIIDRVRLSLNHIGRTHRYYGYRNDYAGEKLLLDALAGAQSTKAPSFQSIGVFLLAYIVCLVPLNYLLLRKRDRKELAWVTAPVIILLFSAGAYAIGYTMKGGQLILNHCTIIEGAANDNLFSTYTVSSIFSPRQAAYHLTFAERSALATEVTTRMDRIHQAGDDYIIEQDENLSVRNTRINMWDTRTFDFLSSVRLNGSIAASVSPVDSQTVQVRVTNNTAYTLEDCSISIQSEIRTLGRMAPGETKTENISAFQMRGSSGTIIYSGSSTRRGAMAIQQALTSLIGSQTRIQSATMAGPAPQSDYSLYFTGWFFDPVTQLKIEKESPQTSAVNLLIVHLPNTRLARPPLPANTPPPSSTRSSPFNAPRPGTASANYYRQMAQNYARSGQLDLALNAAKRAYQLAPSDGGILDTLGEIYQRKGDLVQAERYLRLALKRLPESSRSQTHAKYGEVLAALGRNEEAVSHLEKAAADTSAPIWAGRAQKALEKLGHSP